MEDFMSVSANVLFRRREIVKGPGAKDWMLGMTVEGRTVDFTVRGQFSMCDCLHGESCEDCERRETIRLLLVGTFNPDLGQRGFIFWGIIPVGLTEDKFDKWLTKGRLDDIGSMEQVANYPEKTTQLVYGWYTPYGSGDGRDWIAPFDKEVESLNELFILFNNSDDIRRTFEVYEDRLDRERKWRKGEFITLPADRLWGLFKRGGSITLSLRHVESQCEGAGTFSVSGISSVQGPYIRFRLTLTFTSNGTKTTYHNAWIDVTEDGRWDYIWATVKGRKLSWVQSQLR